MLYIVLVNTATAAAPCCACDGALCCLVTLYNFPCWAVFVLWLYKIFAETMDFFSLSLHGSQYVQYTGKCCYRVASFIRPSSVLLLSFLKNVIINSATRDQRVTSRFHSFSDSIVLNWRIQQRWAIPEEPFDRLTLFWYTCDFVTVGCLNSCQFPLFGA